ncbi:MAG: DUF1080 domain-containing protein, partial [Cyclobacteriaceae bacterium]|nr:DUF1080 domain-containing protein [Cyclobacteriaceae bacterium]
MKDFIIRHLLTLVLVFFVHVTIAQEAPLAFRPLFNGKNLDGWVDVNTSKETWRVEDGILICTGMPIGVMRTDRQYENFILEIEWK